MKQNNMKTIYKNFLMGVGIVLSVGLFGLLAVLWQSPGFVAGSVAVGNQYQATTTPAVADATNLCPARVGNASSTTGVLGSVNITGYGSGGLMILDATTTDNNLRVSAATSSLILAHFPVTGTSTNHFDIEFKRGLLIDYTTGVGTSTISYRCEG